jgi:serine/threonine protein kinase
MQKTIGNYELQHVLRGKFGSSRTSSNNDVDGVAGRVRYAIHTLTNEAVAVKYFDKEALRKSNLSETFKRDVLLLKSLKQQNKHIIDVRDMFANTTKLFVVMSLADGGHLFDYMCACIAQAANTRAQPQQPVEGFGSVGRFSEAQARYYMKQLMDGVQHCHKNGLYLGDICPENLFLDSKLNLKIRVAKLFGTNSMLADIHSHSNSASNNNVSAVTRTINELLNPIYYVAPELLVRPAASRQSSPVKSSPVKSAIAPHSPTRSTMNAAVSPVLSMPMVYIMNEAVDVWSVGIVLYAMLCACVPFTPVAPSNKRTASEQDGDTEQEDADEEYEEEQFEEYEEFEEDANNPFSSYVPTVVKIRTGTRAVKREKKEVETNNAVSTDDLINGLNQQMQALTANNCEEMMAALSVRLQSSNVNTELSEVLTACLQMDPEDRLCVDKVKDLAWMHSNATEQLPAISQSQPSAAYQSSFMPDSHNAFAPSSSSDAPLPTPPPLVAHRAGHTHGGMSPQTPSGHSHSHGHGHGHGQAPALYDVYQVPPSPFHQNSPSQQHFSFPAAGAHSPGQQFSPQQQAQQQFARISRENSGSMGTTTASTSSEGDSPAFAAGQLNGQQPARRRPSSTGNAVNPLALPLHGVLNQQHHQDGAPTSGRRDIPRLPLHGPATHTPRSTSPSCDVGHGHNGAGGWDGGGTPRMVTNSMPTPRGAENRPTSTGRLSPGVSGATTPNTPPLHGHHHQHIHPGAHPAQTPFDNYSPMNHPVPHTNNPLNNSNHGHGGVIRYPSNRSPNGTPTPIQQGSAHSSNNPVLMGTPRGASAADRVKSVSGIAELQHQQQQHQQQHMHQSGDSCHDQLHHPRPQSARSASPGALLQNSPSVKNSRPPPSYEQAQVVSGRFHCNSTDSNDDMMPNNASLRLSLQYTPSPNNMHYQGPRSNSSDNLTVSTTNAVVTNSQQQQPQNNRLSGSFDWNRTRTGSGDSCDVPPTVRSNSSDFVHSNGVRYSSSNFFVGGGSSVTLSNNNTPFEHAGSTDEVDEPKPKPVLTVCADPSQRPTHVARTLSSERRASGHKHKSEHGKNSCVIS